MTNCNASSKKGACGPNLTVLVGRFRCCVMASHVTALYAADIPSSHGLLVDWVTDNALP